MARVIQGLAQTGYMGSYRVIRASDIGACHQRARAFILAYTDEIGQQPWTRLQESLKGQRRQRPTDNSSTTPDTNPNGHGRQQNSSGMGRLESRPEEKTRERERTRKKPVDRNEENAPNPDQTSSQTRRDTRHESKQPRTEPMGPTPYPQLPTPRSRDAKGQEGRNRARTNRNLQSPAGAALPTLIDRKVDFGQYKQAIEIHEAVFGHPAPHPTEPAPKGGQRLNPQFVEWMMMVPPGHVTDRDISRQGKLFMLGNGVVPRQAEAAYAQIIHSNIDELKNTK